MLICVTVRNFHCLNRNCARVFDTRPFSLLLNKIEEMGLFSRFLNIAFSILTCLFEPIK